MAYTPTVWAAGTPAINATRLNNMETGVDDAHSEIDARIALTGMILPYAASGAPSGWLLCDGSAVSRTTYSALFGVLSTTYGAGDGSTTFNLPDLRDRFAVGAGSTITRGAQGGSLFHDHGASGSESATHTHTATVETDSTSTTRAVQLIPNTAVAVRSHTHAGGTTSSGSGGAHNTQSAAPGFGAVAFIVKT